MHIRSRSKAVVFGLTTKMPFAGILFLTAQYLIGLHRMGFEVFYVEEHGKTPWTLMPHGQHDEGPAVAGGFIAQFMKQFGLEDDHWAFWSKDASRRRGLPDHVLNGLFRDAAIVLNLHGGTIPRPEHSAGGRLVYVGTDPVEVEVGLHHQHQHIIDYLEPHCAFFTWGENHGHADCGVPTSERFHFIPTRQPLVMDLWTAFQQPPATTFTTIGNWRQPQRTVELNGEVFQWSKHFEFLKFIDVPRETHQAFELSMLNVDDEDRRLLESHGWQIRDAWSFTLDLDLYREYIGRSRGEFTVAKDQNVRLRSGWFSDRAASYLACGRPVVTQETGFSNILPTGEGLFAFSTMDDIRAAIADINGDYERHSRRATAIAQEYFDYRVVLPSMVEQLDVKPAVALAKG